jgi:hypothetical protein
VYVSAEHVTALEAAQDAVAIAKAWLDHYAKGESLPARPLSEFDEACEDFFDALRVSGWLSAPL